MSEFVTEKKKEKKNKTYFYGFRYLASPIHGKRSTLCHATLNVEDNDDVDDNDDVARGL